MPTREQLRDLIEAGREKEASDLLPHVDASPPPQPGQWTAKDQLAHLAACRLVAAAELDAARTGGDAPDTAEDDVENAKVYAETHHLPAALILERGRNSWNKLVAALDECTDEDLAKPRRRAPQQAAWQLIAETAYIHLADHLGYWADDHGDEAAAEDAAKWAHQLVFATFTEDQRRGAADYNLGRYYAMRERADEAMPYLRSGLKLRPDLLEWAKQDPDLNLIRSNVELASMLAGES